MPTPPLARLGLLPLVALLLALPACSGAENAPADAAQADAATPSDPPKGAENAVGDAPEFSGETLRGKPFDLAELRGDVVLLNVWASWCEPCKEELPTLGDLYRERGHEGLRVVGVSIDAPRAHDEVRRLVQTYRVPYPIVLDPKSRIVKTLKVNGYPTTFIIGRDGRVRWRRDGLIERDDPEVATELKAALDAPSPG